jgi:hypothetical protein
VRRLHEEQRAFLKGFFFVLLKETGMEKKIGVGKKQEEKENGGKEERAGEEREEET